MKGKSEDARLNLHLSKELLMRLKIECVKRDTTMAAAAKEALTAWLKKGVDR
jgi:hypothetical protein